MNKIIIIKSVFVAILFSFLCLFPKNLFAKEDSNLKRSEITIDAIYHYYGIKGSSLLRETYPYDELNKVTYLANTEQAQEKNAYSYLWPYSGSLTAVSLLFEVTGKRKYKRLLEKKVLPGLEQYRDNSRTPDAYASYIKTSDSDRFYDDNIWIGIDFTDLYLSTKEKRYLKKALNVWEFVESGTDTILGGGIYWCEQKKGGKNTCSNAPAAVYAFKLFEATKDSSYFYFGLNLYNWTKNHLQDPEDGLYYDNINQAGRVDKAKYAYNSGQMLHASALLYKLTGEKKYLGEAEQIAQSAYHRFFYETKDSCGNPLYLLNKGNIWFSAVMLRGYIELYKQTKSVFYIKAFQQNMDYAWEHMRDDNGLFNTDWSGKEKDSSKWLLTQFAMAEMYIRLSTLEVN